MAPLPPHRPPILDFVTKSPVLFWLLIATLVIFSILGFGYIVYVLGGSIKRNLGLYDPAIPLHAQIKNEPVPRYLFYARYLNFGRPVSKGSLLFGLQRRFEERYLWEQNERRHEALARIRSILRSGSPPVVPRSRWQLFKETFAKLGSRKTAFALPPSGSATPTQANWVAHYLRENKDTADYAIPLPSTSPVLRGSHSEKKQPTEDAQRCSWWTSDSESVYSQGSYEEDEVIPNPNVSAISPSTGSPLGPRTQVQDVHSAFLAYYPDPAETVVGPGQPAVATCSARQGELYPSAGSILITTALVMFCFVAFCTALVAATSAPCPYIVLAIVISPTLCLAIWYVWGASLSSIYVLECQRVIIFIQVEIQIWGRV